VLVLFILSNTCHDTLSKDHSSDLFLPPSRLSIDVASKLLSSSTFQIRTRYYSDNKTMGSTIGINNALIASTTTSALFDACMSIMALVLPLLSLAANLAVVNSSVRNRVGLWSYSDLALPTVTCYEFISVVFGGYPERGAANKEVVFVAPVTQDAVGLRGCMYYYLAHSASTARRRVSL
jgi:hypothetical protein